MDSRVVDLLIQEHVFGATWTANADGTRYLVIPVALKEFFRPASIADPVMFPFFAREFPGKPREIAEYTPRCSTEDTDMMWLAKHLQRKGYNVRLSLFFDGHEEARVYSDVKTFVSYGPPGTLPLRLCEAVLKSHGVEIPA